MQQYAEAVFAHATAVQAELGDEELAAALAVREATWVAWEEHVAQHGCRWPGEDWSERV